MQSINFNTESYLYAGTRYWDADLGLPRPAMYRGRKKAHSDADWKRCIVATKIHGVAGLASYAECADNFQCWS